MESNSLDEIAIRVIRKRGRSGEGGGRGRRVQNKLHPASSRSQPVIIQARCRLPAECQLLLALARALLCSTGNFLNERNLAPTGHKRRGISGSSSATSSAVYWCRRVGSRCSLSVLAQEGGASRFAEESLLLGFSIHIHVLKGRRKGAKRSPRAENSALAHANLYRNDAYAGTRDRVLFLRRCMNSKPLEKDPLAIVSRYRGLFRFTLLREKAFESLFYGIFFCHFLFAFCFKINCRSKIVSV